ncbi:hypothetical protein XENOCAPTIV_009259, partial [Xenoophorus captivus]
KSDHGQVLLDAVFKHLELTERDYFGLHLADDGSDAPVKQLRSSSSGAGSQPAAMIELYFNPCFDLG